MTCRKVVGFQTGTTSVTLLLTLNLTLKVIWRSFPISNRNPHVLYRKWKGRRILCEDTILPLDIRSKSKIMSRSKGVDHLPWKIT